MAAVMSVLGEPLIGLFLFVWLMSVLSVWTGLRRQELRSRRRADSVGPPRRIAVPELARDSLILTICVLSVLVVSAWAAIRRNPASDHS
jgi:hypothetical protein